MKRLIKVCRRLLTFITLALVATLAIWFTLHPGTVRIVWLDTVIETSAAFVLLCTFFLGFLFYNLLRFWHFLRHGPERWRLRRHLKKISTGHEHITKGLVAIAAGDASEAGLHAVKSRKLLGHTPLSQLLHAQAAQLAGDHKTAVEIFHKLKDHADSTVLGYRGLIMNARRHNKWEEVAQLTQELSTIKPDTPWLHFIRFELLARQKNWDEAMVALSQVSASGLIESEKAKQNRAALLTANSQKEAKESQPEFALQLAEKAVRLAPGWLPAVLNLAERLLALGHYRAVHRLIEKDWSIMPHPQLAQIYSADAKDRLAAFKSIEYLCRHTETTPMGHRVLAEAALAADVWGEARRHLMAVIATNDATQSTYRSLARLERREHGDEQAATLWMNKAVEASADPIWLCHSCGGSHEAWRATCEHCGNFNTLEWHSPGKSRVEKDSAPLLSHGWLD